MSTRRRRATPPALDAALQERIHRLWDELAAFEAAESDAALMPREELTQKLGRELLAFCDQPQEVAATMRRLREGQSLWEFFLFATLGALMVEAYLANVRVRKPKK